MAVTWVLFPNLEMGGMVGENKEREEGKRMNDRKEMRERRKRDGYRMADRKEEREEGKRWIGNG